MKRILVLPILLSIIVLACLFLPGCNTLDQKFDDAKANFVGQHRKVTVYGLYTDKVLRTFEDKAMRFTFVGGTEKDSPNPQAVRIWMGDADKKIMIGNLGYIIEDL